MIYIKYNHVMPSRDQVNQLKFLTVVFLQCVLKWFVYAIKVNMVQYCFKPLWLSMCRQKHLKYSSEYLLVFYSRKKDIQV